jgi:hypothetical protein
MATTKTPKTKTAKGKAAASKRMSTTYVYLLPKSYVNHLYAGSQVLAKGKGHKSESS